jgi:hypothetical protein
MHNIKSNLKAPDSPCEGRFIHGHGSLFIKGPDRHYWSPELNLTFEEENGMTLIRGLYGPRAQVWTMFVLFYSTIGFGMMVVLFYGMTLYSLDQPATILWLLPLLGLILLSLYLVSYSGQRLGKKQMIILHDFLEDCKKPEKSQVMP